MSGTSTKFFGNDIAMDVKADFCDLYGVNKSLDEIHEYIFSYQPIVDDESSCAYWSALALIEWEYGILDERVKTKAEYIIEHYEDSDLYINENYKNSRKKELKSLIEKLNTENLKPKKRRNTFVYRCPYNVGDVLALPIKDNYVYLHVSAVVRREHKIKELESDAMNIKVFDRVSKDLLSIKELKPKLFHKPKYVGLCEWEHRVVEHLWCVGVREKKSLEAKLLVIGNISVKPESSSSVSGYFQFKTVENTLSRLMKIT